MRQWASLGAILYLYILVTESTGIWQRNARCISLLIVITCFQRILLYPDTFADVFAVSLKSFLAWPELVGLFLGSLWWGWSNVFVRYSLLTPKLSLSCGTLNTMGYSFIPVWCSHVAVQLPCMEHVWTWREAKKYTH